MQIYATIIGPARPFARQGGDPTAISVSNPHAFRIHFTRSDPSAVPADIVVEPYTAVHSLPIATPLAIADSPTFDLESSEWFIVVRAVSRDFKVLPSWAFDLLDELISEDYAMTHHILYTGEIQPAQQF